MLILASASPRRQQLLENSGFSFEIIPADIDETIKNGELPWAYVKRLAATKAAAVVREGALALGADTTVAIDGVCLGKPASAAEAQAMLERLSGREHHVYTGWALVNKNELLAGGVEDTVVIFRQLAERDIAQYIASGEPFGKAGSYAIQGLGGQLVDKIDGSYTNVIGLPVAQVIAALETAGVKPWKN